MAKKINESLVKTGMDRDSHPSNIQNNTTYTHAKNANIENENGEFLVLKNEKSNILASKFKEGFKVIHAVNDIDTTNTYFFLVNPTTGVGEFGIIENNQSVPNLEDTLVACGDCSYYNELSEPLEELEQVALQTYTTLLSDACTTPKNGFNFNILNPIKTSIIKNEKTGKTIYFSHKGNPPRYINVDRISDYFIKEESCAEDTILTCPDFDKMRVFKLFSIPKLIPTSIELGGNLKMGVYEFLVAYCNAEGQEISEYYSISTPISIFDENNQIQGQPETSSRTNLSIRLNIENLDNKYTHYKISVIQTADIENATRYFEEGVHTINDTSVLYSTEQNKKETSIDALTRSYLFVEEAEGVATANNVLYQYGVTNKKELNLQPVVNFLGDLAVKWQSHIAPEDLYKNGVNISKYLGYQRDEVVPLAIKFGLKGGYETSTFPLIARTPNETDLTVLVDEEGLVIGTNEDVTSILDNKKSCNTVNRKYKWQYYNTASVDIGSCGNEGDVETIIVPETTDKVCTIEGVNTISSNTITLPIEEDEVFVDLETYINDNKGTNETGCNLTLPTYICDALYDTYPDDTCTPNVENVCTVIGSPKVSIKVGAVLDEVKTFIEKDIENYIPSLPPKTCSPIQVDNSGNLKQDDETKTLYNLCSESLLLRDFQAYNETCVYSEDIPQKPAPSPGVPPTQGIGFFHNYYFDDRFGDLLKVNTAGNVPTVNQLVQYFYVRNSTVMSSGNLIVDIQGTIYSTPFSGSNLSTISNFFATHKIALEAQTGGTLSISAGKLKLESPTICYIDKVYTTGDIEEGYEIIGEFAKFLHKNTLFFKGYKNSKNKVVLDITKKSNCTNSDLVANANFLRYTIYKDCNLNVIYESGVVSPNSGLLIELDTTTYGNSFIVAIDTPLRSYLHQKEACNSCGSVLQPSCTYNYVNYTSTLCGCFSIFTRDVEYKEVTVSWSSITIDKEMIYTYECLYEYPVVKSCKAFPFKKGDFAYWESEQTYPDNNELYNSSNLTINEEDIPLEVKDKFEEIYATPNISGQYVWKQDLDSKKIADFTCRNIRHFKFPDNNISPFMFENTLQGFATSTIYPLGITINEEIINTFLDIALKNNLISKVDRDSIVSYEIMRGDITLDRSVVASGLLYDMRSYTEKNENLLYSNYPYNSYSSDKLNNITNSYIGDNNNNYTFHSPETDYNRPSLPTEMAVQGYMFGKSKGFFNEVDGHPKWVMLSRKAKNLAGVLAGLEVVAEAVIASMQAFAGAQVWFIGFGGAGSSGGGGSTGAPAFTASAIIAGFSTISAVAFKYGRYRYEWLKIFQDLGTPHNFAYYYYSEGNYNYFKTLQEQQQKLRALNITKYLKEGLVDYTNEVTGQKLSINNLMRERSVFLSTGDSPITYLPEYSTYDRESLTFLGENGLSQTGKSSAILKNIASPYVSLKNYLPEQYGVVSSVKWLTTGYRGDLTNPRADCLPIFGGDTFISRHTLKRKHSQFLVNSMNQADRTPFNYFFYNNIGRNPLFYVSYNINKDFEGGGKIFPDIDNDFVMDNTTASGNYYTPPSKFYLYHYGVPSFLCETRINTNFRYAETPLQRQFYPQVGDLENWTQEKNVSIREPEYFFYNKAYSKQVTRLKSRTLADNYNKELNDVRTDFPSGILSSLPDNSENNTYDPWLIYRPLDFFEFPTNFGKLKHVQGIENEAIFVRFENTSILYNKVDYTNDDGQSPTRPFLGGTSVFQRRSSSFYNAQLGFGGSQNTTSVSCEFGHFHVDAKRGQVIQTQPSGQQMEEISAMIGGKPSGMRAWFKEHLPFKILKHFKDVDVDNNYNGVGITMAWDSRYRRVFITKKDYIPTNPVITHLDGKYFLGETEVFLTDNTKFLDVSWTLAFSPILGAWMSFYDFKPNYYVSHNEYFQSGVNDTGSKFGLWSHGLTNKSFGVFYGDKYSFDVEYMVKNEYTTKRLDSVSLFTEAKRYHNEYDWSFNPDLTFNKSLIHNNVACSGYLNLIPQRNNFFNNKNYPKTNADGTQDILISNKDNFQWNYNYFYNRVQNNNSNIPFINYDKNQIEKSINSNIVGFKGKRVLDRISGDYFKNLLKYDTDSRFSLGLKFTLNEVDI